MNNEELIDKVYKVEGFTVWIDESDNSFKSYYKVKFDDDHATVSMWRKRFNEKYPNAFVEVHKGNGEVANGNMHLSNVRESYYLENLRKVIDKLKLTLLWEQQKNSNVTINTGDSNPDPYIVLGVNRGCGFAEVRGAYGRLCRSFHEDKLSHLDLHQDLLDFATKKQKEINVAYQQLKDDEN